MGDIIYQAVVLGLVVLFIVSFSLFIRRLLATQQTRKNQLDRLEKKLDRIIELIDKDENVIREKTLNQ